MTTTLREQSDEQIAGAYLESIKHLPIQRRLDRIMIMASRSPAIRKPLLREFNNLSEREKTNV